MGVLEKETIISCDKPRCVIMRSRLQVINLLNVRIKNSAVRERPFFTRQPGAPRNVNHISLTSLSFTAADIPWQSSLLYFSTDGIIPWQSSLPDWSPWSFGYCI